MDSEEIQVDINKVIINLKQILFENHSRRIVVWNLNERQKIIMERIEKLMNQFMIDLLQDNKDILFKFNKLSWDNCVFQDVLLRKPNDDCIKTEVKLHERRSLPKFSIICFLLGQIYKFLKTGETCNKRELYYRNEEFLSSESALNSAISDVSNLLEASLYEMNIHTTSKGLIFGPIVLKTSTQQYDCSAIGGTLIPADVTEIVNIISDATFVLLLEKDTIFQRLLDDNIMNILPSCILITGKGFPDLNTRTLLRKIWDLLGLPVLALVDANPWGIDIMFGYRFGSLCMAHESEHLAVPGIRWLGVFPSEAASLGTNHQPLNDNERKMMSALLKRPYVSPSSRLALELENAQFKAEIEGIDDPPGYLANKYIPSKIASNDFI